MTFAPVISPKAREALHERHCLVLGGGGFIGTHLCNALAGAGAKVRAVGRHDKGPQVLDPRVEWMPGDFLDIPSMKRAVENQNSVFHLVTASVPESSNRDPLGDLKANVEGTLRVLDVIRTSSIDKLIFTSSGGTVYGIPETVPIPESARTDPISAYGIGKLATEKYLALYDHLHGLPSKSLRISNPYGRYQSSQRQQGVVGTMLRRALRGEPLEIWGDGKVVRDFVHVSDVATALLEVHAYEGRHRVFNVGAGVGMSVNDIAESVEAVLGRGPIERLYRDGRAADVPVNVLCTELIRAQTDWLPRIPWDLGLRDTLAWMQSEVADPSGQVFGTTVGTSGGLRDAGFRRAIKD